MNSQFLTFQLSPDSWEWSMSLWIELCTAHLCVSATVKYSAWCGLRKWRKYSRCSGIDHLQGSEFHWSVDGVTNVDCNSQSQLLQILIGSSCWRFSHMLEFFQRNYCLYKPEDGNRYYSFSGKRNNLMLTRQHSSVPHAAQYTVYWRSYRRMDEWWWTRA